MCLEIRTMLVRGVCMSLRLSRSRATFIKRFRYRKRCKVNYTAATQRNGTLLDGKSAVDVFLKYVYIVIEYILKYLTIDKVLN